MSALGNKLYLDKVEHAKLWDEYNLLSDPDDKKAKAREINFLVPNDIERSLYEQFRGFLGTETIPNIPVEFGGFAIKLLDQDLVHVYFHDEDGILIDYTENIAPDDAFEVFKAMVFKKSYVEPVERIDARSERKKRKYKRKPWPKTTYLLCPLGIYRDTVIGKAPTVN